MKHRLRRAWKFIWTYNLLVLAVAAGAVGLVFQLLGWHTAVAWLLGVVALFEVGPLLWNMWDDLHTGSYGIDILAATAIIFSVILGQSWAAIVIVIMLTGGESLEAFAERRAHRELDTLLRHAPTLAHIIRGNKTLDVRAQEVRVGDKILIKPGETVPVDAEIIDGASTFDEASLTGESMPVVKEIGGQILSGSINQEGSVTAKALRTAHESQYQQIVTLVKNAAASRAPFVRLADRYSIPFTLAAYAIAGTVWVLTGDAKRFLEVIVVATPCPLLLAAPIALVSGMARASKYGIVVKTGSALEKLAEARTVAFDKTGTLTAGELAVSDITTFGSFKKDEVIALAAGLEQNSNHLMAQAILAEAAERKLKITKAKHITEIAGRGLEAHVGGKDILAGNITLLRERDVDVPAKLDVKGTAIFVASGGKLAGVIALEDTVRTESKPMLASLKKLGIKNTAMITGDNIAAGRKVSKALGISSLYAEALPGEKLHIIEGFKDRPVAFVGDGVNDAPSLTAADVGIAIGARGSTAASESADMVILPNDIGRVAVAVAIAKRTFNIARQSIVIGILLSLVLMGIFATGKFSPLAGAIAQEVVDVFVIFNALRAHSGKVLGVD